MNYLLLNILLLLALQMPTFDQEIHWVTSTTCDFGDLKLNHPVSTHFVFRNEGEVPFSIDNVRTTCGCTATDWSDAPVLPGESDTILVEFDAAKQGFFYKKISVYFSHQRKAEKLYIEGYVE